MQTIILFYFNILRRNKFTPIEQSKSKFRFTGEPVSHHRERIAQTPTHSLDSSFVMNRRTFLHSTFATGALATLSAVKAIDARAQNSEEFHRIKVGFLGMSHSHASGKLKAIQESAVYELVGICDDSEAPRRRFERSRARFISEDQLLSQADVVVVESDVEDHARHAKRALESEKHVHLEKAPTDSMESFRELVDLARQKNRLLQMGYMWRYHPGIGATLEAARNGWLGDVYLVRATINTNIGASQRTALAKFRGGMMFELGAHLLDPVVRLLGRPQKVTPFLNQTGAFSDGLADNTLAVLEYKNATATISSSTPQQNAFAHRHFEVLGTNGTAITSPIEPPRLEIDLGEAAGPYKTGQQVVPMPKYSRYAPELADLADAIQKGRPLAITPNEDLAVHETLMKACMM